MFLLTNNKQCPACAKKNWIRRDERRCRSCHTRLFWPHDNFPLIEKESILSFWVFFPNNNPSHFKGWVNAAHLKNPQPMWEPVKIEKPDSSYGRAKPAKKDARFKSRSELGMENIPTLKSEAS
jgi:hypothetical protein